MALLQGNCRGHINSLADRPVSLPLQCATHTIWGTLAMAGFKAVPGFSCKPFFSKFYYKRGKNYHTACTVCRENWMVVTSGQPFLISIRMGSIWQVVPLVAEGGKGRCHPHRDQQGLHIILQGKSSSGPMRKHFAAWCYRDGARTSKAKC